MNTSGHRDLFDHARGSGNYKVEPKFPAAVLLDALGNKVDPEVLFSPDDPAVEDYRDRLGCPCCDARLRWTAPQEKVVGSRPRKGYFSSFDLNDHEECDLASSDDKLSKQTRNRLEFFTQDGPKVLYWNIPYKHMTPVFEDAARPLTEISPVIQTGLEDGDAPITYQIGSMEEFLQLAKHKPFSDPFWDDVIVYDEEHRIAWNDFVFGDDQDHFLSSTFRQAESGASQPKVIAVDIAPIEQKDVIVQPYRPGMRVAFDLDRHLYTIEVEAYDLPSTEEGSAFRSQIIIQTRDNDVFNDLIKASKSGQEIVLHGVASNSPQEIKNVRSRWPIGEYPNNNLRTYLYLSTPKDIGVAQEDFSKIKRQRHYDRDHSID